jgi:hypothetical protein
MRSVMGSWSADRHSTDLNFGPLLEPLAAIRPVIVVELEGHGHTADTGRPMAIEALAGDVVALLDHLGIAPSRSVRFRPRRLGRVQCARPGVCKLIAARQTPIARRESAPLDEDRMPTQVEFQAMRDA